MGGYAEMKWKQEKLLITGVPYRCRKCDVGQHGKSHTPIHCWMCGAFMERGNILAGTALLTSAGTLSAEERGDVDQTTYVRDSQGIIREPEPAAYPPDFDTGHRVAQQILQATNPRSNDD